jgi:hypothetical protein
MESELHKWPRYTWKTDQTQAYKTMEQELKSLQPFNLVNRLNAPLGLQSTRDFQRPTIDICQITTNAFHLNLKKKDNEFFTTSLYKIDQLLKER